ncbi:hypothetical protein D3C85_1446330 [compost metagenome]
MMLNSLNILVNVLMLYSDHFEKLFQQFMPVHQTLAYLLAFAGKNKSSVLLIDQIIVLI